MRPALLTAAAAGWLMILVAGIALAQASAGTRTTPDGKQVLISKDVGSERWAISMNRGDGTVTGSHGDNNYGLVEVSAGGAALIDHDAWRLASRGLPLLPPSRLVPPRGNGGMQR